MRAPITLPQTTPCNLGELSVQPFHMLIIWTRSLVGSRTPLNCMPFPVFPLPPPASRRPNV
jgi:hypothetical protein